MNCQFHVFSAVSSGPDSGFFCRRTHSLELTAGWFAWSNGIALAMAIVQLLCMTGAYETIRAVHVR